MSNEVSQPIDIRPQRREIEQRMALDFLQAQAIATHLADKRSEKPVGAIEATMRLLGEVLDAEDLGDENRLDPNKTLWFRATDEYGKTDSEIGRGRKSHFDAKDVLPRLQMMSDGKWAPIMDARAGNLNPNDIEPTLLAQGQVELVGFRGRIGDKYVFLARIGNGRAGNPQTGTVHIDRDSLTDSYMMSRSQAIQSELHPITGVDVPAGILNPSLIKGPKAEALDDITTQYINAAARRSGKGASPPTYVGMQEKTIEKLFTDENMISPDQMLDNLRRLRENYIRSFAAKTEDEIDAEAEVLAAEEIKQKNSTATYEASKINPDSDEFRAIVAQKKEGIVAEEGRRKTQDEGEQKALLTDEEKKFVLTIERKILEIRSISKDRKYLTTDEVYDVVHTIFVKGRIESLIAKNEGIIQKLQIRMSQIGSGSDSSESQKIRKKIQTLQGVNELLGDQKSTYAAEVRRLSGLVANGAADSDESARLLLQALSDPTVDFNKNLDERVMERISNDVNKNIKNQEDREKWRNRLIMIESLGLSFMYQMLLQAIKNSEYKPGVR